MAKVKTYTNTKTYPRTNILKIQILNTLSQLLEKDFNHYRDTVEKALNNKWFSGFRVYAKNNQNLVIQEISFFIDWKSHAISVSRSENMVINNKWGDDLVINELTNYARVFSGTVDEEKLTTELVYILSQDIDQKMVCKELGLIVAQPNQWAGDEPQTMTFTHPDLQELNLQYRIVP